MADIDIEINGAKHRVGCVDGQEARLRTLAEIVDRRARSLAERMPVFGDGKLFLMTALTLADELSEATDALAAKAPYEGGAAAPQAEAGVAAEQVEEPTPADTSADTPRTEATPEAEALGAVASDMERLPKELWLDPEMEAALDKMLSRAALRLNALADRIDAA